MDNNFYQDEFEQFLQDEVKQHRMYPSDHIWKNIRTELHGYKAWPALTFISLFIITALTVSTLLINHPAKYVAHTNPVTSYYKQKNHIQPADAITGDEENTNEEYIQQIAPEQITAETFSGLNEYNPDQEILAANANNISDRSTGTIKTEINHSKTTVTDKQVLPLLPATPPAGITNNLIATSLEKDENILYANNQDAAEATRETTQIFRSPDAHATADDFLKDFSPVANITSRRKNSKIAFQFYITPSSSFRTLSDEKVKQVIQPAIAASSSNAQNIPSSPNFNTSINDVVRHKPGTGLEMGFAFLYKMSNRLNIKVGAQINVRQYTIETFQSTNDLASLSLINYRGVETISFYSPYNNNTGFKQTQLNNKLLQLSIPLGIQWEMITGKHFGINTEASIQPTLTLNKQTFIMSTDYKHYADGNDFVRKWNINSSLGLNITYKSGATTWELGPQFRYQHLPTYSNAYPIKEYLLDYGVRLGFTRQIK